MNKSKGYWFQKKEDLLRLRRQGYSLAELGLLYKISKSRVFYIFKMFDTLD